MSPQCSVLRFSHMKIQWEELVIPLCHCEGFNCSLLIWSSSMMTLIQCHFKAAGLKYYCENIENYIIGKCRPGFSCFISFLRRWRQEVWGEERDSWWSCDSANILSPVWILWRHWLLQPNEILLNSYYRYVDRKYSEQGQKWYFVIYSILHFVSLEGLKRPESISRLTNHAFLIN